MVLYETSDVSFVGGENWRVRRRAVGPGLHRAYLNQMLDKTFGHSALQLNSKLADTAKAGTAIDIEACFSQLTLDVIGRAVFNYDFDALRKDSPVIQAVRPSLLRTLLFHTVLTLCQFVERKVLHLWQSD